uniref:Uncharacterized protein n=1 Tax=Streptomyces sp. NBC_00049 TaxID=2903617 RepID=A0AAU2K2F4_9ACTN
MLRQAAAAALAGTGLLLCTGPNASAAERRPARLLLEIGQTINLSLNAFGTPLAVPLPPPVPPLNFIGSMVVYVLLGGPGFVRLRVLGFTMEAFHPLLGRVLLKLPDVDTATASTLVLGPAGVVQTMLVPLDMTLERLGDLAGPLAFTTAELAKASATLTDFPPPSAEHRSRRSPTGGAFLKAAAPIRFRPKNLLPPRLPTGLGNLRLFWDGVNEGQL